MKNYSSDNYLSMEVVPCLERLHTEGRGEVAQFMNRNRLGINLLIPSDILYDLVMEGLKKTE